MAPLTRVLVVDDSKTDRLIHRRWLEAAGGFEITEAVTAEEGIERALSERFDCVLMDYVLPAGDGLYAVRMMRAMVPDCPPIVLLSCALTDDMRRNAHALGAAASCAKPFTDGRPLVDAILRAIADQDAAVAAMTVGELR